MSESGLASGFMTDFRDQDLAGARFERVNLRGATFSQVNLDVTLLEDAL